MVTPSPPIELLHEAAIEWAAGGRGAPLVAAAAEALANGIDSPTLRVLAGAPHVTADEESTELAPRVFDELGLTVHQRLSQAAIVEAARLWARRLVRDDGDVRAFTRTLSRLYASAQYPDDLAAFFYLDEAYDLVDDGFISPPAAKFDAVSREAVSDLASGRTPQPVTFGALFVGPSQPSRRRRWRRRRR